MQYVGRLIGWATVPVVNMKCGINFGSGNRQGGAVLARCHKWRAAFAFSGDLVGAQRCERPSEFNFSSALWITLRHYCTFALFSGARALNAVVVPYYARPTRGERGD